MMFCMKVQKGQLDNGKTIWLVLGSDYLPIQPISKYLRYLDSLERSPNTISGYARNLKLYWEYLEQNSKELENCQPGAESRVYSLA